MSAIIDLLGTAHPGRGRAISIGHSSDAATAGRIAARDDVDPGQCLSLVTAVPLIETPELIF